MKTQIETPEITLLPASVETSLSNWDVVESPIHVNFGGSTRIVEGEKAIIRNDDGSVLNLCKPGYTPYTNGQFIDVVERFSQVTKFPVEAIFEINEGKKMLGYLKCTEPIKVGGFEFKDHLMIGNSHDGSTGFFVGNSNIMVRCDNRFAREFRQLKAKHTQKLHVTVEDILKEFINYQKEMSKYYTNLKQFKKVKIDDSIIESVRSRMAGLTEEERLGTEEISTRKQNMINTINNSFQREMSAVGFDLMGLFEGVTHYTTHELNNHALTVNVNGVDENRNIGMFDRGSKITLDSYNFCKEIAKNAGLTLA